jgi:hypothetical protein
LKRSIDASYTPYFAIRYPAQLVANRLLFRTTNVRRILPHLTNLSIKADGYHMLVNITKTLPVSLICHNIFFLERMQKHRMFISRGKQKATKASQEASTTCNRLTTYFRSTIYRRKRKGKQTRNTTTESLSPPVHRLRCHRRVTYRQ